MDAVTHSFAHNFLNRAALAAHQVQCSVAIVANSSSGIHQIWLMCPCPVSSSKHGSKLILSAMISAHGDSNSMTFTMQGYTALMAAAGNGADPVVQVLLEHGASVGITDIEARLKAFCIAACIACPQPQAKGAIADIAQSCPGVHAALAVVMSLHMLTSQANVATAQSAYSQQPYRLR